MMGGCHQGGNACLAEGYDIELGSQSPHGRHDVGYVFLEIELTPLDRHMTRVDPIRYVDLKAGKQSQNEIAQQNGKVRGERRNDQHLRQVRSIRPCKSHHRAEWLLQDVLRDDRKELSTVADAVDFQAQARRLIGTGV